MRASIVIASHNEGDLLWKTVRSCAETTDGLDCEIVVADDASDDGCVDELRRRYGGVNVVEGGGRRGVSPTKDRAARASRGDVLVFLDAHCKPEPGAIAGMVRDVEEWGGRAVVTPRVASLDVERWESLASAVGHGFYVDLEWFRCGWLGPEQLRAMGGPLGRSYFRQPSLVGCAAAMTRDLYESLGGFDTGMRTHGSEDLDFGLKAWTMGRPMVLDPELLVGHRFRKRFDNYAVPPEHALFNQMLMARKHYGDAAWDDWASRFRRARGEALWGRAWSLFEDSREAAEAERDFVASRRCHDEYWYASEFGLSWPLTLPGSPLPVPSEVIVPRFTAPASATLEPTPTPEPNVNDPTIPPPGDDEEDDDEGDDKSKTGYETRKAP